MAATLFISDLHLTGERPDTLALFARFLTERAVGAGALYVLGDLFEAWLGDDLLLPGYEAALAALRRTTEAGTPVHVMAGNRDFLLGEGFAEATGCQLLQEPARIDIDGTSTLLLHGDSLCTDDTAYQELRRTLRDPVWVARFLNHPPEQRIEVARQLRDSSREAVQGKEHGIMDVNADAVAEIFRRHGVKRLIHGHTHRPRHHRLRVDGRPVERIVLGDWQASAEILVCDNDGCRLETFS